MSRINPQDWYWTLDKWATGIPPANADKIVDVAKRLIDEFVESNPNLTKEEMTVFCNDLWAEYNRCRWMPCNPYVYNFQKDDYTALIEKALSPDVQQIDIDTLGEYLACWGDERVETGERYPLGDGRYIYPVYSRWPDRYGAHSLLKYEITSPPDTE